MSVSKNAYYNWLKSKDKVRVKTSKTVFKERIRVLFKESREIYGSYRIQKMLERENLNYSRSYIGILMKEMGLKSILNRKLVITTDSKHTFPIFENVLNRDFNSLKMGEKWVSDITYIQVNNDWNYLTTVLDLADKKIVGWSLSQDMITENTIAKA